MVGFQKMLCLFLMFENLGIKYILYVVTATWLRILCKHCYVILGKKDKLWIQAKVVRNWLIEVLIEDTIPMIGKRLLVADSCHSYGYQLCSCSHRLVPLFVWSRFHAEFSKEKQKETSILFVFISLSAIWMTLYFGTILTVWYLFLLLIQRKLEIWI